MFVPFIKYFDELEDLKSIVETHFPRIHVLKEQVVKSQKFEEASKLREIEKAYELLLSKISDALEDKKKIS